MRTIGQIMLEQARASRERAEFYRQLARTTGKGHAVSVFEKSARELEARAAEIEKYATWFTDPEESPISPREQNVVGTLQRAIEIALTLPKTPG
jgi:hypothetical protein